MQQPTDYTFAILFLKPERLVPKYRPKYFQFCWFREVTPYININIRMVLEIGINGVSGLNVLLHVESLVEEQGQGLVGAEDGVLEMIMKKINVTLFHAPLGHHGQDVQQHVVPGQKLELKNAHEMNFVKMMKQMRHPVI